MLFQRYGQCTQLTAGTAEVKIVVGTFCPGPAESPSKLPAGMSTDRTATCGHR